MLEGGAVVLVVDDNLDSLEALGYYLLTAGFRVETATNGREAIEKTRSLMPDVIVMDLAMPELDGWQATHQIKSDETTRRIPIIAVTGHAFAEAKEAAQQAGCDVFLTKPVDPVVLATEIGRVVELARQAKAVASRRPYELLLYVGGSDASSEARRILDQLMAELDTSQVQFVVRELSASPGAAPDILVREPILVLSREGSPAVCIKCDKTQLEHLGERLREAGLPPRKTD